MRNKHLESRVRENLRLVVLWCFSLHVAKSVSMLCSYELGDGLLDTKPSLPTQWFSNHVLVGACYCVVDRPLWGLARLNSVGLFFCFRGWQTFPGKDRSATTAIAIIIIGETDFEPSPHALFISFNNPRHIYYPYLTDAQLRAQRNQVTSQDDTVN